MRNKKRYLTYSVLRLVIFIFLLSSCTNMDEKCYELISTRELISKVNEKNKALIDADEQLSSGVFVFKFDNSIILIPNDPDPKYKGMLIHDKNCYEDMIKNDKFPEEVDQDYSVWEPYREQIKSLPESVSYFKSLLKFEKTESDFPDYKSYLQYCYTKVVKNKGKDDERAVAFCVLIGDYVNGISNAEWKPNKRYGLFNHYFEPVLVNKANKSECSLDFVLSDLYQSKGSFNELIETTLFSLNINSMTSWK